MSKQNKSLLPIAIIIASIILGGFFYATQKNKQDSIERQQGVKLQEEGKQYEAEKALEELKLKQEECKALLVEIKKKGGNVIGITYNEIWRECAVTFIDSETNEIETYPLSHMKKVK
jgi:nitrogen fixation-related uncharacterized protein